MTKLLFFISDPSPTQRVDVSHLFGRHLPENGTVPTIIARMDDRGQGHAPWRGGSVVAPPGPMGRLGFLRFQLACLRRLSPGHDAIQVRNKILLGLLALRIARRQDKPFFYWMSFLFPEEALARARLDKGRGPSRRLWDLLRGLVGRWLLYRILLPRCDHVFVQSEAMRRYVASLGIPESSMTPVPMGVDTGLTDAVIHGRNRDRKERKPTIVYLGALDAARRMDFLVEALVLVRRRVPQAKLVLVGDALDPSHLAALKKRIADLGLGDAVRITGWLSRREAWREALSADVGACPLPPGLVTEVASLTKTVELMALGVPVVVTAHPDQGTLAQRSGGGIVVPYDPAPFAEALAELLLDRPRAVAMGRRGREHIMRERSYEVLSKSLADTYSMLTGGNGNGPRP